MQGFLSDRGHRLPFTRLQQLLRTTLLEAYARVDLPEPEFQGFGGDLVVDGLAPLPFYAVRSPDGVGPRSRYTQGQTDIVRILRKVAKEPDTLSVVITDNAQDVHESGTHKAPGFDRVSFIKAITALHNAGYGVWLVGILNDFEGLYYSVTPVFERQDVQVNQPLWLEKPRPVYSWVIARDHEKGRRFVSFLYRQLAVEEPTENIHALELAPGWMPEVVLVEPEGYIPTGDPVEPGEIMAERSDRYLRIKTWRSQQGSRSCGCVEFDPNAQSEGHKLLLKARLQIPNDGGGWVELPPEIWQVSYDSSVEGVVVSGDTSDLEIPSSEADLRHHSLSLRPLQVTRAKGNGDLEVRASVYANPDALPEDFWVRKWSTSDDIHKEKVEGKTLYLADVVFGVLAETLGAPRPAACLRLYLVKG